MVEQAQTSKIFYPFRKGSEAEGRMLEDLALFTELDLDIYRLSISWSRLFPKGDEETPDEAGINYYDSIFQELKKQKIKIFLTINHYALPLNLVTEQGGWKNRKTIGNYLKLVTVIFNHWGELIDYYLPFNEINAGYFSPYNGIGLLKPEEELYAYNDIFLSLHHQFLASAQAIALGKKMKVKGQFGAMISCFCYYPLTPKPEDNLQLVLDEQINQWFCMDVLARGEYPYYMNNFFSEHGVDFTISEADRANF